MSIRDTLDIISRAGIRKKFKVAKIADLGIEIVPVSVAWKQQQRCIAEAGKRQAPINCFAYALGLHRSKLYHDAVIEGMQSLRPDRYASPDFVNWLLSEHAQLRRPSNIGDLVVYFDTSMTPKHAGIISRFNMVRSKWGEFEPIFVHKPWHVPRSYGPTIRYYRLMPFVQVEAAFASCL